MSDGLSSCSGSTQSLSLKLFSESQVVVDACFRHSFVQGILDGTLDIRRFRLFIAQDGFFLEAFARAYCALASRVEKWSSFLKLHNLAQGVVEERQLQDKNAARWGVDLSSGDLHVLPATREYVDFLRKATAGNSASQAAGIAAMTPCMKLYHHLASAIARDPGYHAALNPYREWVEIYTDPQFGQMVATLEDLLDEHCADYGEAKAMYVEAMRCEFNFFDGASSARLG